MSAPGTQATGVSASNGANEPRDGSGASDAGDSGGVSEAPGAESAPGEHRESVSRSIVNYIIGLSLAAGLTGMSFWVAQTQVFWQPGVIVGLVVLAIAQMGIHLVFFLHLTTGADNLNNSLAVAFGVLIIVLFGAGSLWIMTHLNDRMEMPPSMMDLREQH